MTEAIKTKTYFLDRSKHFVEVELVKETSHKRQVKVLEGVKKGKTISVHPHGVAWGKTYPRVFQATEKPTDVFNFKGRVLLKRNTKTDKVPQLDTQYRFQPWLSHVIDNINGGENTLLTGGTGVGKTTAIVNLAAITNQPVVRINFNAETRISDLLGKMQVRNGETKFEEGVLPQAMRHGWWMILDELDSASPEILSLLNPVLEAGSHLTMKENGGEVIPAHPNFRIFATANTIGVMQDKAGSYAGTNAMNIALMDRFCVIAVPSLPFKEEVKLLKTKVRGIKNRWAKRIVEFANQIRNGESGIEFNDSTFSTRMTLAWAKRSALLNSPIEGAKIAFLDRCSSSEQEAIMRVLETCFGNDKKEKSNKKDNNKVAEVSNNENLVLIKKKRGRPRKVVLEIANA